MELLEKIATAKAKKTQGNDEFKKGDLKAALRFYHEAVLFITGLDATSINAMLSNVAPMDQSIKDEIKIILSSTHLNMCACHLKLEKWTKAISYADKVLKDDAANAKALFRRGQANFKQENLDRAELDFHAAITASPNDTGIRDAYEQVKAKQRALSDKSRAEMKELFSKQQPI